MKRIEFIKDLESKATNKMLKIEFIMHEDLRQIIPVDLRQRKQRNVVIFTKECYNVKLFSQ
jgi:hypothetical protein